MKNFHYVEEYDEDGNVHHLLRRPDPIKGEVYGEYSSAGVARYHERILNAHQSSHYALNEFEHMYQSEISFLLIGMWDGGVEWMLGNGPNIDTMFEHARARGSFGNEPTMEEALVAMTNAARQVFPDSDFTRGRPTDITLRTTPTLTQLMWDTATAYPGFQLIHTPTTDPYVSEWGCTLDGTLWYEGRTPEEAIHFMIEQEGKAI